MLRYFEIKNYLVYNDSYEPHAFSVMLDMFFLSK